MKKKKILSFIMMLVILLVVNINCFASNILINTNYEVVSEDTKDIEIRKLFDERAKHLNNLFNESEELKQNIIISKINNIDLQLSELDVEFLSASEVVSQFPETKSHKSLSITGQTMNNELNSEIEPKVSTPQSNVNTWASYRTTYTTGGVTYNIQRLVAQPTSSSSSLANIGSRIVTFSRNWKAGVVNAVSSVVESTLGNVPGANVALTFYDAISGFVSGISTTTEVDVPNITYSWSNVTTAVFTYVRLNSQSDSYQWLSLILTKTQTAVGYNIPTFGYKDSNGSWVLTPEIISGTKDINATPTGYDSNSLAVSAYTSASSGPLRRAVSSIQISGPESATVQTISPCYPNSPAHCE